MVDEFFYMGWQSILRLSHLVSREKERPTTHRKRGKTVQFTRTLSNFKL